MIGLLIFGLLFVYVGILYYVTKILSSRAQKIAAIVIGIAVPFWDLPIGYYEYHQRCAAEGGMKVFQPFAAQDKVFFDSFPSYAVNDLLKMGFNVVEVQTSKGIAHHELDKDHRVATRIVSKPESIVRVSITRNKSLAWNMLADERVVTAVETRRMLARHTIISWHGGWLQKITAPLLEMSLVCGADRQDPTTSLLLRGATPGAR